LFGNVLSYAVAIFAGLMIARHLRRIAGGRRLFHATAIFFWVALPLFVISGDFRILPAVLIPLVMLLFLNFIAPEGLVARQLRRLGSMDGEGAAALGAYLQTRELLIRLGTSAGPHLLAHLRDEKNPRLHSFLLSVLGHTGGAGVFERLAGTVESGGRTERLLALGSLGHLGDPRGFAIAEQLLGGAKESALRANAAAALVRLDAERAAPLLIARLREEQEEGGLRRIAHEVVLASAGAARKLAEEFPSFPPERREEIGQALAGLAAEREWAPRVAPLLGGAPAPTPAPTPRANEADEADEADEAEALPSLEKIPRRASEQASALYRAFGIAFTPALETIRSIDVVFSTMRTGKGKTPDGGGGQVVTGLGSFLGECLRLSLGGEWQLDEAGGAPVLTGLGGKDVRAWPFAKVRRRLAGGDEEESLSRYCEALARAAKGGEA